MIKEELMAVAFAFHMMKMDKKGSFLNETDRLEYMICITSVIKDITESYNKMEEFDEQ